MKINKAQFKDENSGNSRIAELNPFDIIINEGVHMFDEYALVHIVFWKNLTDSQEKEFLAIVKAEYPEQLINIECMGEGEYKFYLRYGELL